MAVQWYYVQGDARIGPVTQDEMMRLIGQGVVDAQTLVWRQGLPGWDEAGRHLSFGGRSMAPSGQPPAVPTDVPPQPPGARADAAGMSRRAERYMRDRPQYAPAATQAHDTGPDGLYRGAPARGFGEAISVCLRQYFTFSGRASRSEYWYFFLFLFLVGIVTSFLDGALFGIGLDQDPGPLNSLTSLALLIPSLAVMWRRLHDTGRTGWWVGGFFLALIGFVILMFMVILSVGTLAFPPATLGSTMFLFVVMGLGFVVYCIAMLVFLCTRGDPGPNRYG